MRPAATRVDPHAEPGHVHGPGCGHDHHDHRPPAAPLPVPADSLLSARGLWMSRAGRVVLEAIDLDVRAGEIVTVIGPNGAGKTTLVRLLLGLERPDHGEILRRPGLVIGYAPQRFDVDRAIPLSVDRFLRLGGEADESRIVRVLDEVGARRTRGQQIAELSGGELQRVILARALLRDPALLVLDEPVRGVDYTGEAELYTLIGRLASERHLGVLLVSHDLHIVMAASDRVVCINRHACCSGVPEAVARDPAYVRLFGPEAARAFAVYSHHHDHTHDLAGERHPVDEAPAPPLAAGERP